MKNKKKKYWHTITVLSYNKFYNADIENNLSFIDEKDELTDRQILNRLEKHYGYRPERIARTQVNLCAN